MKKLITIFVVLAFSAAAFAAKTRDIQRHITTKPSQKIAINGFNGSKIEFKSWDKNEVYLKLSISISSSNEEYEDAYIQAVKVSEDVSDVTVTLRFEETDRDIGGGFSFRNLFNFRFMSYISKEIRGEIYVPRSNPLSTDLRYGSLSLEDMKGELELIGQNNTLDLHNCSSVRRIDNNYGKTSLDNCGGDLRLEGKSSTITIEDFDGAFEINADYSTITANRVKKGVTVNSRSGKLSFDDVRGDLTVNSDYSKIVVNNVGGFADISTRSGKVRAKLVEGIKVDAPYTEVEIASVSGKAGKPIVIQGQSGRLDLTDAIGDVTIENPYSTVNLRNIRGNVNLSAKSGRVSAAKVVGNWSSNTEYCSVTVLDLAAQTVTMINKSNPIEVELTTNPNRVEIENQYGDVNVKLPVGFAGDVRLKASYGKVRTNFALEVESIGGGALAVGKVGSGNGSLKIETTSANITLMQK